MKHPVSPEENEAIKQAKTSKPVTQKIDWEKRFNFSFGLPKTAKYINVPNYIVLDALKDFIEQLLLSSQSAHDEEIKKQMEKAVRLYLQDAWNDQSDIQALSPDGKTIIWGGIVGKQITAEWKKVKKHFDAISLIRGKQK